MIKPQILKGFRDFLPEIAIKRQFLRKNIQETFELYGFLPIETPSIEYLETFSGNIGEDEKLFFKFEDQGKRKVALRYDQTVPTCRFVAQHFNELNFPFKRYQIQTVWRSEKPQKGRYREFLQCDADIFGEAGSEADAEVIALSLDIYRRLGFSNYQVKINDRSLYKNTPYPVVVAIDKLVKIGRDEVLKEIVGKGYTLDQAKSFINLVDNIKPNEIILQIMSYLKDMGSSSDNYVFEPKIARSFNYSSGPIWEIVIPEYQSGSVLGGERYDQLANRFINNSIPATGFAVGFDRTLEAMEELNLFPKKINKKTVLVTVFSPECLPTSIKIITVLRNSNIPTYVYPNSNRKLDKQIKHADKNKIQYVIIAGPDEIKTQQFVLKDLTNRTQQSLSIENIIKLLN